MKIFLKKAIIVNRAPFASTTLDFDQNEISVLSAVNGRGKTTILSHLADVFYEMAKIGFQREFENKENKLYRISSALFSTNLEQPSFVYFRFNTIGGVVDYVDVRDACTEEQYNAAILLEDKIPFVRVKPTLDRMAFAKIFSENLTKEMVTSIFSDNILTYFPSYRHEIPGYLNEPYKISIDYGKGAQFVGFLINPIEVTSGLPHLANWIMDIVLDSKLYGETDDLIEKLNTILSSTLISKNIGKVRLGIGPRGFGTTRIQIVNAENSKTLYPSIFTMSSGESSILCLFGELLRQADNIKNNVPLDQITGIVLIDEVENHLHIKLQKETLPILFNLFPNVQFIVSSHSPFLSMGLAEKAQARSKIVDLDNLCITKEPILDPLYVEVYQMMLGENEDIRALYEALKSEIGKQNIPIIVTEGKTDIQHLQKAKQKLGIADYELAYLSADCDAKLKTLLEQACILPNSRKIVGIFDRDVPAIISTIEKGGQEFNRYGNNVYAFAIPVPKGREQYDNVSIEFYYRDEDIKREKDGRCLYFDNELFFDSNRRPVAMQPNPPDNRSKKIFCADIGTLEFIHSKSRFADLVAADEDFAKDFDFSNFQAIFDKIKKIIDLPE